MEVVASGAIGSGIPVPVPMLWIPDAVCGAVVSARTGSREYQDALGDRLTVITI